MNVQIDIDVSHLNVAGDTELPDRSETKPTWRVIPICGDGNEWSLLEGVRRLAIARCVLHIDTVFLNYPLFSSIALLSSTCQDRIACCDYVTSTSKTILLLLLLLSWLSSASFTNAITYRLSTHLLSTHPDVI